MPNTDTMHSEERFTITIAGSTYQVETDDGRHGEARGSLRIHCTNGAGFTVCDQSGYCNPFVSFWKSSRATLTGAAREAVLIKIARQTVARELGSVADFVREMNESEEPIGPELAAFLAGAAARAALASLST
jgi:hypothetical protein